MLKIWIIALSCFLWANVSSEDTTVEAEPLQLCDVRNRIFKPGEQITYKIYYNIGLNMAVGEVVFDVKEQEDTYLITAYGRSFPFYDMIFKVRDTIETVVDMKTLRPIQSVRIVNEGNYTGYDKVVYDYDQGIAISTKGRSAQDAEVKTVPITACSRDILSTMYGMRNVPIKALKKSKQLNVDLLMDRKNYPINVHYLGEDEQRIRGYGKEKVHVVNPELIESTTFKDKSAMRIYVSKDGNNLPLMIETPISVGKIKAVLDKARGLKYRSS